MASKRTDRLARTLLLAASLCATVPTPAQETQRYQAIALPEGGRQGQHATLSPKVLILDTRDGHLWTWAENETVYQDGTPRIGTVLIYQGKLRPGEQPGEVLEQHFP